MKVTLKLTDAEKLIVSPDGDWMKENEDDIILRKIDAGYSNYENRESGHFLIVRDVDKLREFLKDELRYYQSGTDFDVDMVQVQINTLKSILSKLDKAVVQNDCDNCDSSGYIPENKEGGNKECPECSDEPKKCSACDGSGSDKENDYYTNCDACDGDGFAK